MTGYRATLAGTLVVATACLATLALIVTTCVLYLRGDLDGAKDAAVQGSGALAATLGLLAVTGRPGTVDEPVPVTTAPGDAVAVEPAFLDDDRGHADPGTLALVGLFVLVLLLLLGVLPTFR